MNFIVGIVGAAFLVFVGVVAFLGRKSRRKASDKVASDIEYIYEQTQKRHRKKRGRASSELAAAREAHLKVIGSKRAGASR